MEKLKDKKTCVEFIFKIVYVAIALTSTIISFAILNKTESGEVRSPLMFYTNWSVWFVTITAVLSLIVTIFAIFKNKNIDNDVIEMLKFASLIMIIATFIISAFVLPDKIWKSGYWTLSSVFKHFLLPIFTVVDFLLYTRRGTLRMYFPFTALVVPFIYWVIIIVRFLIKRANSGGAIPEDLWPFYYPYGFTNIDNGHSLGFLLGLIAGIVVGLIGIGYALYFLKRNKKTDVEEIEA